MLGTVQRKGSGAAKGLYEEHVDVNGAAGQAAMRYDRWCRLYGDHAMVHSISARTGHEKVWSWNVVR